MKSFLVLVVLSAMTIVMASAACFGNENIQAAYDRFEVFRNTKAFDPTNPKVPLRQYHYYETDGTKRLAINIGGNYMVEYFKKNAKNEIETEKGQYDVKDSNTLNYKKTANGFEFDDWSNGKKFESTLRKIDAEIPSDVDDDYKTVLTGLNVMRKKMFDFQNSLSSDDLARVQLFEVHPRDDGFYAQYIENGAGSLSVSSETKDGKVTVSGRMLCDNNEQKFNLVNGKVAVDGEPRPPIYH